MTPRRNAFTLTELLVVIAAISVLAAFLLPSLEESLEQARRLVCQDILKQNALAQTQYASDCRGYYPSSYRAGHNTVSAYRSSLVESGWLIGLGYMPFELSWCPNVETGWWTMPRRRDEWNTLITANPSLVVQPASGYYYRFEGSTTFAWPSGAGYRSALHPTKDPKFSRIAITWDMQGGWVNATTGKLTTYSHENGYNILYGDGSSTWLHDPGWSRSVGYDTAGPFYGTSRDQVVWNVLDRK